MNGGDGSLVSRIESLEKIERFRSTNFAYDDSVRTQSKRLAEKFPYGDCRQIWLSPAWFQSDQIRQANRDFGRVLDQYDSLLLRYKRSERVEKCGFACSGTAADQNRLVRLYSGAQTR